MVLDNLNISHYETGTLGKHLNQILLELTDIIIEMQTTIDQINDLDNYIKQNILYQIIKLLNQKNYTIDSMHIVGISIADKSKSQYKKEINYNKNNLEIWKNLFIFLFLYDIICM